MTPLTPGDVEIRQRLGEKKKDIYKEHDLAGLILRPLKDILPKEHVSIFLP